MMLWCALAHTQNKQAARAGAKKEADFAASVEAVNAAVASGDPDALLAALQTPATTLAGVESACSMEYLASFFLRTSLNCGAGGIRPRR